MATCYWCYWGWPKQIADIYDAALAKLDDEYPLEFGPGHIVWSDENWEDEHIDFCLKECDEYNRHSQQYSREEIEVVRWSLDELRKVPPVFRTPPDVYEDDDEHPERYPPPADWMMIKCN